MYPLPSLTHMLNIRGKFRMSVTVLSHLWFLGSKEQSMGLCGGDTVTPILKESRIFNMCVIIDTGYINTTMRKLKHSWDLEYKVVSGHISW